MRCPALSALAVVLTLLLAGCDTSAAPSPKVEADEARLAAGALEARDYAGNPSADPSGIFSGWLFVNGVLSVDGNFRMRGLAYAQNDISYHGVGTGGIYGAMISRNIRDLSSTSIDSDLLGNALVNYNCGFARAGGGQVPDSWTITRDTYRELCDSCT
jgi:hypothetical protein